MKWVAQILAVLSMAASGCGTVRETYHPQTVGPLPNAQGCDGITLQLRSPTDVVQIGKPAAFSVTIRNASDHAIWIPKKPQQGFFWTYPNGRHDCYMIDREESHFYQKSDCQLLEPGAEIQLPGLVETSYFDHPGITEFLAEIDVARNTNRELTPFWSGRVLSNAYGVQLVPFNTISGAR